jgi:hypothetical protein
MVFPPSSSTSKHTTHLRTPKLRTRSIAEAVAAEKALRKQYEGSLSEKWFPAEAVPKVRLGRMAWSALFSGQWEPECMEIPANVGHLPWSRYLRRGRIRQPNYAY